MTDNEITREKTFSEELPYFKERIKEVFDNYDNPNGYEDPLYIAVLRDSNRLVRKAEEEINRQQAEIERLKRWENLLKAEKHSLIKSEAIKEFAKRLKKVWWDNGYESPDVDFDDFVDNLVKEMVGEGNA